MTNFSQDNDPLNTSPRSEWLPLCEEPNENWCGMVNDAYAEGNLRTSVYASGYLRQRLSQDGIPLSHQYDIILFQDTDEAPEGHYLGGTFVDVSMGANFNVHGNTGQEVPFARLVDAFDKESGVLLTQTRTQHILVPLTMVSHLELGAG